MKANYMFNITSHNLNGHDKSILKSLVGVLQWGDQQWNYSENLTSDVFVVDVDVAGGLEYWNAEKSKKSNKLYIPLSSAQAGFDGCLIKPIRGAELVSLLSSVKRENGGIALNNTSKSNAESLSDKQQSPLSSAEKIYNQTQNGIYLIEHEKIPKFVIDSKNKFCYLTSKLSALSIIKEIVPSEINIKQLTSNEFQEDSKKRSIITFYWFLGIYVAQGELLRAIDKSKTYKLKRFPDFGQLPHNVKISKMATQLVVREMSILDFSKTYSEAEAIRFFNAAYLCGWLVEIKRTQKSINTLKINTEKKKKRISLVSKIRFRLGLVSDE